MRQGERRLPPVHGGAAHLRLPFWMESALSGITGFIAAVRMTDGLIRTSLGAAGVVAATVDIGVLAGPALDAVGPVRFQDIIVAVALIHVGITPRIVRDFFNISAGGII